MPTINILHTNDLHGHLNGKVVELLRGLREETDFYFDTGDVIKAGNLAIPISADPAWATLAELRCTAGTLGNRESHPLAAGQEAKLKGLGHPVLVANMQKRSGEPVFPPSLTLEIHKVKVGVLGVMVPMVTAKMKTQALSAYLWTAPIPAAIAEAKKLKEQGCDVIFALTHIGISQDRALAESKSPIDIIFGGHSHTRLDSPEQVHQTWICQGGSHGKAVGTYMYDSESKRLTGHLVNCY